MRRSGSRHPRSPPSRDLAWRLSPPLPGWSRSRWVSRSLPDRRMVSRCALPPSCSMPVATSTPYSERTRPVLLGNLLLALAWAALQGEFSLRTLITGQVLGYLILLALTKGGVLSPSPY